MNYAARLSPLALLTLAGCATTFHAGAPEGAVGVIAHRGASAHAPENTLAAFAKALEMGADWFELDCHLTRDGQAAVLHDGDLKRVAGIERRVAAMTMAELKQVDAGSWFDPAFKGEPIPTLEESLDFAKGRIGVYLEVKSAAPDTKLMETLWVLAQNHAGDGQTLLRAMLVEIEKSRTPNLELTRKCLEAVKARRMRHQVVLQSFSPVVCVIALAEMPELRTEFLGSDDPEKPEQWARFVEFGMRVGVHGFNINKDSVTAERIAMFHNAGKTCAVWTVDDPEAMLDCAAKGADAIITNRPALCITTLQHAGKRPKGPAA